MEKTKTNKHRSIEDLDSGISLQHHLDRIPVHSIPGIKHSHVVELKAGDTLKHAIHLLYEKDVIGSPIVDVASLDTTTVRPCNKYIGFIELAPIILWSLQQCEKSDHITINNAGDECGILAMLAQNPRIGEAKIGELAKAYIWDPYFPINLDDTLFHVLLLFSKHSIQVVPVEDKLNSQIAGFITRNAVIQLLLQSSGLEWFDSIADKALSEFRFEGENKVIHVYGGQSLAEALDLLHHIQLGVLAVAVIDRATQKLIGSIRSSDAYLLLENNSIFDNIKNITAEEFIHMKTDKSHFSCSIEPDIVAGNLRLRNEFLQMDSLVTSKRSDTLKHVMTSIADQNSSFSFIVNDLQQVTGIVSSRDIIIQFSPPCIDSTIHGGGFFESALENTGCHIHNGTMISNR